MKTAKRCASEAISFLRYLLACAKHETYFNLQAHVPRIERILEVASSAPCDEDDSEALIMAGMAHGNQGLADYSGLDLDPPGGTGCHGCGGRGCENCNWGET